MKSLTGPEVARAANLDYRTFHNYVRAGYLTPSVDACTGSGRTSRYSHSDLVRASRLASLVELGIHPRVAAGLSRDPKLYRKAKTLMLAGETLR